MGRSGATLTIGKFGPFAVPDCEAAVLHHPGGARDRRRNWIEIGSPRIIGLADW